MTTIRTPRTLQEAQQRLGSLDKLMTAKEWEKAAIIATFVRLHANWGGKPDRRARGGTASCSAQEFADLGINGLRGKATVTLYVQRWLDATDGVYPTADSNIVLPTDDWPPTRTGTDGFESEDGARKTIDKIVEKHGAGVVASAIVDNAVLVNEVSRERLDRVNTPQGRQSIIDRGRRSQQELDEAIAGSHSALADHIHHETELELMSVESGMRRALAKMEQYPQISGAQRQRLLAALDRVEQFITILRKGSAGMTDEDRDFLATAGILS